MKTFRAAKRMKNILENRLKRFRMLDQDEFQEMLKSFGQQSANEQPKLSNAMDSIGGMQLASEYCPPHADTHASRDFLHGSSRSC